MQLSEPHERQRIFVFQPTFSYIKIGCELGHMLSEISETQRYKYYIATTYRRNLKSSNS